MKIKIVPIFSTVLLLFVAVFSVAKAQSISPANIYTDADIALQAQGEEASNEIRISLRDNSTSTEIKNNDNNTTSTKESDKDELDGETHRSEVASFVKSLLNIADREGGIGEEVRVIAQEQNDSASTSAETITKIKNRNGLKKILFGEDYKSLGQLRSEIVRTQNNIDQLKNLLASATNSTTKADLSAQIKVLEDLRAKEGVFVTAHENTFSLFGWFVKMFAN